jgi:aryl-alcohol dehydrogenase-like predicted oxidoreductase
MRVANGLRSGDISNHQPKVERVPQKIIGGYPRILLSATSWWPILLLLHSAGTHVTTCAFSWVVTNRHEAFVRKRQSWQGLFLSDGRFNTDNNNDNVDDNVDELSKLISKRSQIKRVKKDTVERAQEKLATSIEPVVDLDLDTLPEFSFERNRRRRKDDDDDADGNDSHGSASNPTETTKAVNAPPIIDYMADYADENDWHVVNRIGVTSICWGDPSRNFVAASGKLSKQWQRAGKFVAGDVALAVQKLLAGGITLLETSPSYGSASRLQRLSAEDILGRCFGSQGDDDSLLSADYPEPVLIESLAPGLLSTWKTLLRPGPTMVSSLEKSLHRLGSPWSTSVDLFLAPMPLPGLVPTRLVAAGLAQQIESGQANYVGVTGVTQRALLQRLMRHLESYDVTLTANAFALSMTNTRHLAMIQICKDAGVVPLILDPLDGGLASGVYTATNPSGGLNGGTAAMAASPKFSFAQLDKLQPLHSVQETIAQRVQTRVTRSLRETQERFKGKYGPPPKLNTDITTTQVALHWIIAKGGVPLVEVNNPAQADQVLGCLGWQLTEEEVSMLDSAIALCKL